MALSSQRTTSVKAVQLVSGSLYQVTKITNEISLEAQVNNNNVESTQIYKRVCYAKCFLSLSGSLSERIRAMKN